MSARAVTFLLERTARVTSGARTAAVRLAAARLAAARAAAFCRNELHNKAQMHEQ
jgi:hypothetical protein